MSRPNREGAFRVILLNKCSIPDKVLENVAIFVALRKNSESTFYIGPLNQCWDEVGKSWRPQIDLIVSIFTTT